MSIPVPDYGRLGLRGNPFAHGVAEGAPVIDRLGVPPPAPAGRELVQLIGVQGSGKTTHLRLWSRHHPGAEVLVPADGPAPLIPHDPIVYLDEIDRADARTLTAAFERAAAADSTVVVATHRDLAPLASAAGLGVRTHVFPPLTVAELREWVESRIAHAADGDGAVLLSIDEATLRSVVGEAGASLRRAGDLLHVVVARRLRSTPVRSTPA